jgi:hypothetical protein
MPLILTPLESKIESISKDAFKNAMIKAQIEGSKVVASKKSKEATDEN